MATSKGGDQTIGETLTGFHSRLEKISDTPDLDAQVLLARQLNQPRSWVLAHPEVLLTTFQIRSLETAATHLEGGQPLAYILGAWDFFGLEFEVTPDVLIPRPETELLVERAIKWLKEFPSREETLRVMDVGTGSGCISIALAVNVSDIIITATDISAAALKVAGRNAKRMQMTDRITYVEADLFPLFSTSNPCSLIVTNLPYIPSETLHKSSVYGREPTIALDGGPDGLTVIRRFLEQSTRWLLPGGLLLFEIEASEGPAAQFLASRAFPKSLITLYKDLSGRDRLLEVQT